MRIDLYRFPHKAQRHHLFSFAQELGRADLNDERTRTRVVHGVRHIVDMLRDHAQNEERYIHPLYEALGVASELHHEHDTLEIELAAWQDLAERGQFGALYGATMRVIATYLLHLDAEERAQSEHLWPAYDDAQLGAVLTRFKAERAPAAARDDLALLVPALSVAELAGVLRGAPLGVRDAALAMARETLEAGRCRALEQAMAT